MPTDSLPSSLYNSNASSPLLPAMDPQRKELFDSLEDLKLQLAHVLPFIEKVLGPDSMLQGVIQSIIEECLELKSEESLAFKMERGDCLAFFLFQTKVMNRLYPSDLTSNKKSSILIQFLQTNETRKSFQTGELEDLAQAIRDSDAAYYEIYDNMDEGLSGAGLAWWTKAYDAYLLSKKGPSGSSSDCNKAAFVKWIKADYLPDKMKEIEALSLGEESLRTNSISPTATVEYTAEQLPPPQSTSSAPLSQAARTLKEEVYEDLNSDFFRPPSIFLIRKPSSTSSYSSASTARDSSGEDDPPNVCNFLHQHHPEPFGPLARN